MEYRWFRVWRSQIFIITDIIFDAEPLTNLGSEYRISPALMMDAASPSQLATDSTAVDRNPQRAKTLG